MLVVNLLLSSLLEVEVHVYKVCIHTHKWTRDVQGEDDKHMYIQEQASSAALLKEFQQKPYSTLVNPGQ